MDAKSNNETIIIAALREGKDKKDILKVFKDYKKNTINEQISLLEKSMYNPQTFYSSGKINKNDELDLTIDIFLMGDWKINEYYDKAGLWI